MSYQWKKFKKSKIFSSLKHGFIFLVVLGFLTTASQAFPQKIIEKTECPTKDDAAALVSCHAANGFRVIGTGIDNIFDFENILLVSPAGEWLWLAPPFKLEVKPESPSPKTPRPPSGNETAETTLLMEGHGWREASPLKKNIMPAPETFGPWFVYEREPLITAYETRGFVLLFSANTDETGLSSFDFLLSKVSEDKKWVAILTGPDNKSMDVPGTQWNSIIPSFNQNFWDNSSP